MGNNKRERKIMTIKPVPGTIKAYYAWELPQDVIDDMANAEIPEEAKTI